MIGLPAPDRAGAPYTGYGRAHWERLADHLLLAVRPYASPAHSLIDLPGPPSASGRWSDGLEGYARTFLLAAFRVAGAGGADPHGLLRWYAEGLAAGVDPDSSQRWPRLTERRQARVEAASVVIALHETRRWLWDRLDDRTRNQLVEWLTPFIGTADYDNNWVWFQNVAEAFLRTVGGPWSSEDIERNLAWHEEWYVGDGWYSDGGLQDGRRQNFDYYTGWALHFYPLWYQRILGEQPAWTYRQRLGRYLGDARHLVGAGGAPLFQGRSLTYRFAMLAPFWTGALFDATPLPAGETRRLTGEVLRHFVDGGAVDADGLLPIGWHGAFPRIRQLYSGPGSPYWAGKGFAGLLLPAGHPVWTAPEQPLPVERADDVHSLRRPGWVVSTTAADGIVRVANHGSDHLWERRLQADDPFYLRHGYASHAAPELSAAALREPVDSHVALLDGGGRPSHRGRIERTGQGGTWAASQSRALWLDLSDPGPPSATWYGLRTGPWLRTASVLRGAVEVRLARVEPATVGPRPWPGPANPGGGGDPEEHWPADPGPWRLHVGGYALAGHRVDTGIGDGWARADRPDGLCSLVTGLRGFDQAGITPGERSNPLGVWSAVPWVRTTGAVRPGAVYAAAVVLTGRGVTDPADAFPGAAEPAVEVDGATVVVRWADGATERVPL
ncbi:DUF2264 domain-containing protein [Polymorphospora rubra]|uniref:DUF2264 domain-containing protein n=1 Tax=Polymorphospora rubra TaxID=338584 RepID=A0A810MXL0_9ACTN|nr:DUF2264 domain-containing protein [Polymorphospora rubra]BCJ64088.1 hypothetical protein Prubr_11090 [Polymorphospora rubra]